MDIRLGTVWRLGGGEDPGAVLDPRLFRLLEAVRERGSLRAAVAELEFSYRHAWGLLARWRERLDAPLVHLERGRGASLTPLGEKLVWARRRVAGRLEPLLESLGSEIRSELEAVVDADARPSLRLVASHGLEMTCLRGCLRAAGHALDLQHRGSVDSLQALSRGRCDLAGFHVALGVHRARIAGAMTRYLDSPRMRLVRVAIRRQGLMWSGTGRPGLTGLADLARPGARFINRQAGSGTRLLLDLLLEDAGVGPAQVDGYDTEEFTHLAVAAVVAGGAASVGFGIEAAARRFGLEFLPLAEEEYYLAADAATLASPEAAALLGVLRGRAFRTEVAALPGYDPRDAGQVRAVEEVFPRRRRGAGS